METKAHVFSSSDTKPAHSLIVQLKNPSGHYQHGQSQIHQDHQWTTELQTEMTKIDWLQKAKSNLVDDHEKIVKAENMSLQGKY